MISDSEIYESIALKRSALQEAFMNSAETKDSSAGVKLISNEYKF